MDNGLPESVGELRAWEEFYNLMKTQCDVLRIGPREELSPPAAYELQRIKAILHKIGIKLTRLEKKK